MHQPVATSTEFRLTDLAEVIDDASLCLAEMEAQHLSETRAFGDSWPGAQVQIAEQAAVVEALRAEWDALVAELEATTLPPLAEAYVEDDDIPF